MMTPADRHDLVEGILKSWPILVIKLIVINAALIMSGFMIAQNRAPLAAVFTHMGWFTFLLGLGAVRAKKHQARDERLSMPQKESDHK